MPRSSLPGPDFLTSITAGQYWRRFIVPIGAACTLTLLLIYRFDGWGWWVAMGMSGFFLALGLFDMIQTRHSLMRNFPALARIRWVAEALRPFIRHYVVEDNNEGKPYTIDQRALVYERSKGENDSHPFGTELDVYTDRYRWISHSMAPEATPETAPLVTIGGPQCDKPYPASVFNISAMSFGSLSAHAIEALNKGASLGGFYHDTGEGSISPYHRKNGGDLVWELGSGYFGCRDKAGNFDPEKFTAQANDPQVKMIEIKLSQGAKPGRGGLLPGHKVSAEIAATRGIEIGKDCISPSAHSTFSTPLEMMEWAAELRKLSGGKPVGAKFCVGHGHEVMAIMKAMLETGITLDFIVVDGGEGGTGAAPEELSNHMGRPLVDGLVLVRNALVGAGLRDKVKLGASGKVYSASSLAINCAIGADWCNAARAFMFSLGCIQSLQCHTGRCPTGIATQDQSLQRGLVIEDKTQRVANYHKATLHALSDILGAVGVKHPKDLRPHHVQQRISAAEALYLDQLFPFLDEGDLLEGKGGQDYQNWWDKARPDSFALAD